SGNFDPPFVTGALSAKKQGSRRKTAFLLALAETRLPRWQGMEASRSCSTTEPLNPDACTCRHSDHSCDKRHSERYIRAHLVIKPWPQQARADPHGKRRCNNSGKAVTPQLNIVRLKALNLPLMLSFQLTPACLQVRNIALDHRHHL
ncbi:MAG: hypothetical protein WCK94_12185, partial [Comamonadaceae bacterium]